MIFIDKMKDLKIYKTKTYLPTKIDNKKKGSAILLLTPNYESSKKLMNSDLFVNMNRYNSYYIEKDVSYYINKKHVEEVNESVIIENNIELSACLETKRSELPDQAFGVPSKRKFPLDTEAHVRSAIKFFNYVDPEDEEELARNIKKAMKKFNITDVHVSDKNRFSKYYTNPKKESVESDGNLEYLSEDMVKYLHNAFDMGDKVFLLGESSNDVRLKQLLYNSRIRQRKEVLNLLDQVKADNPWIRYAFPEMKKFNNRNLFIDLYYYSSIFFENNNWVMKRGFNLYADFMTRLLNHPNNRGYSKQTIFIPILDWDITHNAMVWNFRQNINPISCIYQMMFTEMYNQLINTFGKRDIIFVGKDKYFKINFSNVDKKNLKAFSSKFRVFCVKICKNEEFDINDVDTSADNADSPEVIRAKIIDKIETSRGVDLTPQVSKAVSRRELVDNTVKKQIDGKELNTKEKEDMKLFKGITKNAVIAISTNDVTKQDKETKEKIEKEKLAKEKELDDEDLTKTSKSANNDEEQSEDDANFEKLADRIADASMSADSEEDAMDNLDDDDVKELLLSINSKDDKVNISAARAARITELDNKLMDKEVNGKSVKDILADTKGKEENITELDIDSPNDEWNKMSFINFDRNYNIDKDIINIFRHFSKCSKPISVVDISVTNNSTSEDRVMLYTVKMEDFRGKRFTVKLDIPIMEDNRFLLRGNYKSIETQSFNMPIIKTELDTCQLISNYNKIFLYRFGGTSGKSMPIVSRIVKAYGKYNGTKIKFTLGNNAKVCSKYRLPIDYIDLSGIFSKIETTDWIVYFNQDEIRKLYTVEDNKGFPFAYNKKLNAVEYYPPTITESFCKMLYLNLIKQDPKFEEIFLSTTRPSVCSYSRASIMSSKIPLAIICGYHVGLRDAMDRAGIQYKIVDKLTKEDRLNPDLDWIQFENGYVIYNCTYSASMFMNGLKSCSTDLYPLDAMDNKAMYLEFLDNFGGRIKAAGLDNFYDLFVDPMIEESLNYYKLPTNYIDILLYGNALLCDNKYVKHTDNSTRRLRRYQLISVYTYKALSAAYNSYSLQIDHSKQSAQFAIKQSAVIDLFLTDTISSDDSCINALRDIETTNSVTTKGPSGMNADRAYSVDKRAYDDSMLNVLGMSTGFAGNVGITRQATLNANVTPDGYIKQNSGSTDNMNDANTLTATESLIPFGSTHDDPMRTAMSFVQTAKHMVVTEESDPLLVTSGADEVIPYSTSNRFAYKAAEDGDILEYVEDDYIMIQYKSGKKEYINLKETIEKNSDGGYYSPLKLSAADNIKAGKKFKKNQILAYDKKSFSASVGESNKIAYNVGKLAKVAIINSDEGFEDSGIISNSMAKKLATRIIVKYEKVIEKDAIISYIAKEGDHIEASDNLMVWQDTYEDTDANDIIAGLNNDEDISELGKRKLKSEVTGTIKGIKIFRTTEIENMSPSLQKIVKAYEKPYKELENKYKENGLDTTKIPAHYVLPPTGKLKKAQDALYFEFYVEYLDTVGVGDKVVYFSANKAVEKNIFPEGKEPYTAFRPNEPVDAFVSEVSIDKRLVTSSVLYGSIQKAMIELDRSVKDIMGIKYDDSTV